MEETEIKRCAGHCCRDFTLPESPEEMKARKAASLKEHRKWVRRFSSSAERTAENIKWLKSDISIVPEMVIYLGEFNCDVNGNLVREQLHHYTCKNFDEVSGDCKIYEYRPQMCSKFPYGYKCWYKNCQRIVAAPKEVQLKEEKELVICE